MTKLKKRKMKKPRCLMSLDAKQRHAGKMKDRRSERGGSKNDQQEYLEDNSSEDNDES
jgi:hypothetical protein